ncbi:hypothetical protein PHYPO_G00192250 [Pangasianodon hypophthalmus]|uniref:Uncharacterized protein n=1 Tax=Pangasianodon hypophthalmus TaxID=310915 RepID=A0A5N5PHM3_PANHP|nr:hypothetical protein PHYPO_G00192250 [Pangasianodon hypophthalmus]
MFIRHHIIQVNLDLTLHRDHRLVTWKQSACSEYGFKSSATACLWRFMARSGHFKACLICYKQLKSQELSVIQNSFLEHGSECKSATLLLLPTFCDWLLQWW